MIIVVARFLFLTYIAKISRVSLANAIYKPSLTGKGLAILFIVATCTIIFDYYITIIATNGAYEPQLLGYSYYLKQNMLWGFPLKIVYYFSEITVMNYMYILAKKAWSFSKPL